MSQKTFEELELENKKLREELSSGICSAHQTPDPLNCNVCNEVKILRTAAIVRMEMYKILKKELAEVKGERDRLVQHLIDHANNLQSHRNLVVSISDQRDTLQSQLASAREALESVQLYLHNVEANGRPHGGRNTNYPDGCKCDHCEQFDWIKRESDAIAKALSSIADK